MLTNPITLEMAEFPNWHRGNYMLMCKRISVWNRWLRFHICIYNFKTHADYSEHSSGCSPHSHSRCLTAQLTSSTHLLNFRILRNCPYSLWSFFLISFCLESSSWANFCWDRIEAPPPQVGQRRMTCHSCQLHLSCSIHQGALWFAYRDQRCSKWLQASPP